MLSILYRIILRIIVYNKSFTRHTIDNFNSISFKKPKVVIVDIVVVKVDDRKVD